MRKYTKFLFPGFLFVTLVSLALFIIFAKRLDPVSKSAKEVGVTTPAGLTTEVFLRFFPAKTLKSLDRFYSRIVDFTPAEEQKLGVELAKLVQSGRVAGPISKNKRMAEYIQKLFDKLVENNNPKGFKWSVNLIEGPVNAFAVPGGVVSYFTGIVKTLNSEAELVSVMGHEKGHIELDHCIDTFRKLAKKGRLEMSNAAIIDDDAIQMLTLMFGTVYSKFQEDEADEHGFETLLAHGYDPRGQGKADLVLASLGRHPAKATIDLFEDLTRSHPTSVIRAENYLNRAKKHMNRWENRNKRWYVGRKNLERLIPMHEQTFPGEWVTQSDIQDEANEKRAQAAAGELLKVLKRDFGNRNLRGAISRMKRNKKFDVSLIRELDLSNTSVDDLGAITELPGLKRLLLNNTNVADISPVGKLDDLRRIEVSKTRVKDIGALQYNADLEHVDVSSTGVTDISPLAGLANIEIVNTVDTEVNDISKLRDKQHLFEVVVNKDRVSEEEAAKFMAYRKGRTDLSKARVVRK